MKSWTATNKKWIERGRALRKKKVGGEERREGKLQLAEGDGADPSKGEP